MNFPVAVHSSYSFSLFGRQLITLPILKGKYFLKHFIIEDIQGYVCLFGALIFAG